MHKSVGLLVYVFASSAILSAAACSGDDDDNGGSGGTGGTYSTGGTGTGGTGTGGTGTGGTGTGGTGTGGTGTGGTGGVGTGGTGTGGTGTGGTGTDAGAAAQVVTCPGTVAATIQAMGSTVGAFAFSPATASVAMGGVVKFQNTSTTVEHSTTSGAGGVTPVPDGKWDADLHETGDPVCVKFNQAGSYPFYCKYHSATMTGSITVTP